MRWSSLLRARRVGGSRPELAALYVLGVCSSLLLPALIWNLGLIIQLITSRGGESLPRQGLAGASGLGRFLFSPLLGRADELSQPLRNDLLALVGAGFVIVIVEALLLFFFRRVVQRAALRVGAALKRAIGAQTHRLGPVELLSGEATRSEELYANRTERVQRGLVAWWRATAQSAVLVAVLLLTALAVNFWLTLLAILLAAFIWQRYEVRKRRVERQAHMWRERAAQYQAMLLERIRLASLAAGYAADGGPDAAFDEGLERFQAATLRAERSATADRPLLLLAVLVCAAFLLLVIGLSPEITLAGSVVSAASLMCAYVPVSQLRQLHHDLDLAEEAASEIFAYLDHEPSVRQLEGARALPSIQHDVELDNVTLRDAEGRKMLDGASLSIRAGQRVAIMSSNPHSPLALVGLLPRLYDPADGRVLFDGRDIRNATLDTVRAQTALVLANGMQFTGTIEENIRCGDASATPQAINDAVKRARATTLVKQLPQGLATIIGPFGRRLPPGQACFIGLARALLRNPSLLVIEEPDVELDPSTAAQMDEALAEASAERTLVFLPARLATLRSADSVYLFHDGKLVAQGAHAELVQQNELYRHLNYLQFNAFRDTLG